jgi:hypothetical protein
MQYCCRFQTISITYCIQCKRPAVYLSFLPLAIPRLHLPVLHSQCKDQSASEKKTAIVNGDKYRCFQLEQLSHQIKEHAFQLTQLAKDLQCQHTANSFQFDEKLNSKFYRLTCLVKQCLNEMDNTRTT